MKSRLLKFLRDTKGSTAVEYALLATLLSLALFAGLQRYYVALDNTYNVVISNMNEPN